MGARLRRWLTQLREFNATLNQFYQRQALLNQPLEEEFVHRTYHDGQLYVHGRLAGPNDIPRRGITRHGWCPECS